MDADVGVKSEGGREIGSENNGIVDLHPESGIKIRRGLDLDRLASLFSKTPKNDPSAPLPAGRPNEGLMTGDFRIYTGPRLPPGTPRPSNPELYEHFNGRIDLTRYTIQVENGVKYLMPIKFRENVRRGFNPSEVSEVEIAHAAPGPVGELNLGAQKLPVGESPSFSQKVAPPAQKSWWQSVWDRPVQGSKGKRNFLSKLYISRVLISHNNIYCSGMGKLTFSCHRPAGV